MTGAATSATIRTLIFDVLGTVVDEAGTITAETVAAAATGGLDPDRGWRLAEDWMRRHDSLISEIAAGHEPWRSNDALRRASLLDAVEAAGVRHLLPPDVVEHLARAGHRPRPWPDSPPGLRTLQRSFVVVALSNADLAQLADMSADGGLSWHCVLSAELVKAYKPDPAVYQMALDRLGLDPAHTMMVASHPWDLRAAEQQGMRTAYVSRPGEASPAPEDHFDIRARSLAGLAEILTPGKV
jgi:2-haloacid dehalogenase